MEQGALQSIDVPDTNPEVLTLRGHESVDVFQITLPMIIDLVAEKNLDLAIGDAQIEQAKGYVNQAFAALLPSIRVFNYVEKFRGGEIFIGPTPFSVDRVTYQGRLSADYQVQMGGKSLFQISAMKSQLNRIQAGQDQTLQTALLDALTQYFTLLRDNALVDVSKEALNEADAEVKFNEARFRSGFGTKLEIMQAKTLQAERKSDVIKAQNQREMTAITLGSMLDLPLSSRVETIDTALEPITFMDESLSLSKLYQSALDNRPDVKELVFQIKEAKARYGVARADLFPTLSLSGYKKGVGPNLTEMQESNQMFASISIDLLKNMGLDTLSNMKIQKARIKEAILNKEKQLNEIQKGLAKAYEECSMYREAMRVSEDKAHSAGEAYRIAGARHKAGVGVGLEVVQAQKDLTDARMEHVNAIMNYNIAQLKLMFESGQLTPKSLLAHIQIAPPEADSNQATKQPTESNKVKQSAS